MINIIENYNSILENIEIAAHSVGKKGSDIKLVAVTKFVDNARIEEVLKQGVKYVGESRVQELNGKLDLFKKYKNNINFIGQLQKNKVKYIVGEVECIQSVDRVELAQEINRIAKKKNVVQKVFIEINIGNELQKGGVPPSMVDELLEGLEKLDSIYVNGLMCIPPVCENETEVRKYFAQMKAIYDRYSKIKLNNVNIEELSMGMSEDYCAAILEGSTMVRVGSALFGPRDYSKK